MNRKEQEFHFIHAYASEYPVKMLVGLTTVSRAGYYKWLNRHGERVQEQKDQEILPYFLKLFDRHKATLGRRRMKLHLEIDFGIHINEKRVARILDRFGLRCQIRQKRFRRHTHLHDKVPNVLERQFKAVKPGRKFCVDITYIPVKKGRMRWVYACVIIDLFNREVVASVTSTNQDINLVFQAVHCLKEKGFEKGAILHSDQGFQFTNPRYRTYLKELGITQSMSRRGNCWDNACIENFFSHLKSEMPMFSPINTVQEIHDAVGSYTSYYNKDRGQTKLKSTPEQYRLNVA